MSPSRIVSDCPITVLLLRHAERAVAPADDPPLTPAGIERAHALVSVAGNAGVRAIFTTQYVRSVQTAKPLAHHLRITPTVMVVDPADPEAYAQELVASIRSASQETPVLVVSHTNTIPMIVAALGAAAIPPVSEAEFDKLFFIEAPKRSGRARIVQARYGAPSAVA